MGTGDDVANGAARLLQDALAAAAGAGDPALHEPGVFRSGALFSSPLPLGEADRRPAEGESEATRSSCTLTPALSQGERETARGTLAPATEVSASFESGL